ncbi:MAG: ABC transporter ATP-binding protein [Clostridia bacterium]
MDGRQILKDFISTRKWHYVFGILILVAASAIGLTIPKFLGLVMDGLKDGILSTGEIRRYLVFMAVFGFLVFVLKYFWRYLLIGSCRKVECHMREHLFAHLQTLPVSFYSNNKTGDLIAHAINDVQAIRITFGFGVVAIVEGVIINSVAIFFMAGTISPLLTLMALGPMPVLVFIMMRLGKRIRRKFTNVQKTYAGIAEKVQENITGIRVIKSFAQEKEEVDNFLRYNQDRVDAQMDLTKTSALMGPAVQISFGVSFLFFLLIGSELVVNGTISLGDYIAFNTYMLAILGPVTNISRIIEVWQRGIASFKRLDAIFKVKTDINDAGALEEVDRLRGKIEIRNLDFHYPGSTDNVLKNIDVTIERGKTLGIIGKTGCGKTTLVNLLLRLYKVEDGKIHIDGTDINQIPLDVLRQKVGYVPQDNFMFSSTIRKNIEFFGAGYSEQEVEHAARMSGVYDSILTFPQKFDTMVGERGVTLSGGQKQRISIARAIIKKPSVLILDDSLSAVDSATEEEILGNMKVMLEGKTGIMISHRVSAVMHADEIILMDRGRIVERGTHGELMALKGNYHDIYMDQSGKEGTQA